MWAWDFLSFAEADCKGVLEKDCGVILILTFCSVTFWIEVKIGRENCVYFCLPLQSSVSIVFFFLSDLIIIIYRKIFSLHVIRPETVIIIVNLHNLSHCFFPDTKKMKYVDHCLIGVYRFLFFFISPYCVTQNYRIYQNSITITTQFWLFWFRHS